MRFFLPFRRPRRAPRRGFSFIELMIVFVIFGLIATIGVPRFDYMRSTTKMRSAKTHITSTLATARATAIRRGRVAEVRRTNNVITVVSETVTGGTTVTETIVQPVRLDSLYGVTVAATAPTLVRYDSRGLASLVTGTGNLTSGTGVFAYTRDTYRDSVCITRFGAVMKDGCL